MKTARLRNLRTGSILAENVEKATSWWRRLAGFLSCAQVRPNDGLWFDNCSAIHTLGMRREIDAIFLDGQNRVLSVRYSVPRHRFIIGARNARAVVELGAAASKTRQVSIGDRLALE
ncbi:MAG: DUF192 domain-containing protein [Candidatus Cybelea sp.]